MRLTMLSSDSRLADLAQRTKPLGGSGVGGGGGGGMGGGGGLGGGGMGNDVPGDDPHHVVAQNAEG